MPPVDRHLALGKAQERSHAKQTSDVGQCQDCCGRSPGTWLVPQSVNQDEANRKAVSKQAHRKPKCRETSYNAHHHWARGSVENAADVGQDGAAKKIRHQSKYSQAGTSPPRRRVHQQAANSAEQDQQSPRQDRKSRSSPLDGLGGGDNSEEKDNDTPCYSVQWLREVEKHVKHNEKAHKDARLAANSP